MTDLIPPQNALCSSNCASDVINAAQDALEFIRTADSLPDPDGERDDPNYAAGRNWLVSVIQDALGHAKALADADRLAARELSR